MQMPRRTRAAGLALAVAVATAAMAWWPSAQREAVALVPVPGEPIAGRASTPPAAPMAAGDLGVVFHSGLEQLPASLRGTDVSGELEQDAQGNLKVTRGVRNVFDYFLSGTGEETPARQRARLKAYIEAHLGARAAAQALALVDTYIAYKDELDAALRHAPATTLADMQARVDTLRGARARRFSPDVVQAFFGEEDAYDRYSLDKLAILNDPALSPQEKARRVAALRDALPEAQRRQGDVVEVVGTLDTLTADWRQRSGTPQELRQLRETLVGAEAAQRLETLDRQTEAWNSRVAAYLQQRALIVGDVTLADSTRRQKVDALRSEAFSATEQLRIETIERIQESGTRDASPASRQPTPG
jgi:lipase chaperone LimK